MGSAPRKEHPEAEQKADREPGEQRLLMRELANDGNTGCCDSPHPPSHRPERPRELRGAGVSVGRRHRHRLRDHRVEGLRHPSSHWVDWSRRLRQRPGDDRLRSGPRERRLARQHLVQHAPEAVDVTPTVELCSARGLLRAHVRRRAYGDPCHGQLVAASCGDCSGNPEVGHDRLAAGEQDILGLDIAVYYVVTVGVA